MLDVLLIVAIVAAYAAGTFYVVRGAVGLEQNWRKERDAVALQTVILRVLAREANEAAALKELLSRLESDSPNLPHRSDHLEALRPAVGALLVGYDTLPEAKFRKRYSCGKDDLDVAKTQRLRDELRADNFFQGVSDPQRRLMRSLLDAARAGERIASETFLRDLSAEVARLESQLRSQTQDRERQRVYFWVSLGLNLLFGGVGLWIGLKQLGLLT